MTDVDEARSYTTHFVTLSDVRVQKFIEDKALFAQTVYDTMRSVSMAITCHYTTTIK